MIDGLGAGLLIAATLASGLTAGLFYGFACAVMPGLRQLDDRAFVAAMQSINRRILNAAFLIIFAGTPALTVAAGVVQFVAAAPKLWWPMAGAITLSVLSLVITAAVNVPLNNVLDTAGAPARIANPAAVRAGFESRWVRWNAARASVSTLAFGCLVGALVIRS